MMKGSSREGSKGRPLESNRGQAIIALMAAVVINNVPLDLVLTDGKKYMLLRFRGKLLLKYENLSGRQVGAKALAGTSHFNVRVST